MFEIDATRGYLRLGPTRLSFLDWGGMGRAALLLHGITSNAAAFWQLAPALRAAGYRPIALDMPGHGESDVSQGHAVEAIAALVGDAVEALGLDELLLIGHSWGGATALRLASGAHPARSRLAQLVLIDPAMAMSREWGEARLPSYLEGVGEPASLGLPRVRANNPSWLEADCHWKALALEQCRHEQVAGFFLPTEEWNAAPSVAAVSTPLLVLVADPAYTVIAPERLAEMHAALPASGTITVVPGTTHNMLRGSAYRDTLAALLEWIGG